MAAIGYPAAMLRRLCLILLMLGLALPATAAPLHCAPAPVAAAHNHEGHHRRDMPDSPLAQHDCIGCAAPFAALAGVFASDLPPVAQDRIHNELHLAGLPGGPETPPPRA